VYQDTLFGIPTVVKHIRGYYTCDTTDTTVWLHISIELAAGFGVIWWGGGEAFSDHYLRAARIDGVVYGDTTIVSVLGDGGERVPKELHLYQSYPNPFNPTTAIHYNILSRTHVRLLVYDVIGRLITTLVDEEQTAGSYKVHWDANNHATGMYIYRLETGGSTLTRKMLLVR
jgi:hypothetical protein